MAGQHAAQLLVVVRVDILLWTRRSRDVVSRWSWLVQQDGCHCYFSYVFFRMLVGPQECVSARCCSRRSLSLRERTGINWVATVTEQSDGAKVWRGRSDRSTGYAYRGLDVWLQD